MPISHQDVGDSLRRITLTGRLDGLGTAEIAPQFTALTSQWRERMLVDLTAIDFLASIGIRALISNAKLLRRNGGRMVLLVGHNPPVTKVLEATGIDSLIPTFAEAADAEKAALA